MQLTNNPLSMETVRVDPLLIIVLRTTLDCCMDFTCTCTKTHHSQLQLDSLGNCIENCDIAVLYPVFCAEVGRNCHMSLRLYHILCHPSLCLHSEGYLRQLYNKQKGNESTCVLLYAIDIDNALWNLGFIRHSKSRCVMFAFVGCADINAVPCTVSSLH